MRSKLSPDGTKLIMATAGGYLLVVHDLDLTRLPDDLAGFNRYLCTEKTASSLRQDTTRYKIQDKIQQDTRHDQVIHYISTNKVFGDIMVLASPRPPQKIFNLSLSNFI